MEELKRKIDAIIEMAFRRLETVYYEHKEGFTTNIPLKQQNVSRLVFPSYFDNDEDGTRKPKSTRIREQELRFSFVESFNEYCNNPENNANLFYSVETPTKETYSGFTTDPKLDPNGRSAEFDMVIYDENLKRVCLIEFKANNAKEVDHKKDFLKLEVDEKKDETVLRYFIEIVKSYEPGTITSLKDKKYRFKDKYTQIRCFALEGKRREGLRGEDISFYFK